jgi:nitrite reductase/ring-hydroxylating ferredoxin subunit
MSDSWISVCNVDEVEPDGIFAGEAADNMVAIYLVDGKYYATDNVCPHAFTLLSDGWLDGLEVECPLHGARFNIESGALLQGPAQCGIKTFQVRVHDGKIECLI